MTAWSPEETASEGGPVAALSRQKHPGEPLYHLSTRGVWSILTGFKDTRVARNRHNMQIINDGPVRVKTSHSRAIAICLDSRLAWSAIGALKLPGSALFIAALPGTHKSQWLTCAEHSFSRVHYMLCRYIILYTVWVSFGCHCAWATVKITNNSLPYIRTLPCTCPYCQ